MNYTIHEATNQKFKIINLVLAGLTLGILVLYIFNANRTTDLQYRIGLLRKELVKENLENDQLANLEEDNIDSLITFAKTKGMIEVKTYSSFFEESGIALKH